MKVTLTLVGRKTEECEDFPLPLSYDDHPEDVDFLVPPAAENTSEREREKGKGRGRGRGKGKGRGRRERQDRRVQEAQELEWVEADEASDRAPTALPIVQQSGSQTPLSPDAKPIDYWKLFFDDDILDLLVKETNR